MKIFVKTLSGLALTLAATFAASAMPITKQLNVTVVTVCDDIGANCAAQGPTGNFFFEAETDKIWAQAGIDIHFIFSGTLNNTTLRTGATGVGAFTNALSGPGTTMYLVDSLACASCTLYGEAYLDAGGLVINMGDVMSFNAGAGRLDTVAHELGHNLGLDVGIGSTNGHSPQPNYLMASGANRFEPNSLADICPVGACFDLLPQAQIDLARSSSLLVDYAPDYQAPEPGGLVLVAVALICAAAAARRQRA